MNYPQEWNDLPRHERRKKIRELQHNQENKSLVFKKIRNMAVVILVLALFAFLIIWLTKKSPKQTEFEQKVKGVSLGNKVQDFSIEGRAHIPLGTDVSYQTNPPTSGDHLGQAQDWGIYSREIDDKAVVHSLEHGGIWISYKEINDEDKSILESVAKENSQSVIVSPRSENDAKIAVVSWGKMMKFDKADKALIQKYINTYKNQSPEKLAR